MIARSGRKISDRYVSLSQLKEKEIYLMISFFDEAMRIPDITTVIYLGKDIFKEATGKHYFQDYKLFSDAPDKSAEVSVIEVAEDQLMNFFNLQGASELLGHCAELDSRK